MAEYNTRGPYNVGALLEFLSGESLTVDGVEIVHRIKMCENIWRTNDFLFFLRKTVLDVAPGSFTESMNLFLTSREIHPSFVLLGYHVRAKLKDPSAAGLERVLRDDESVKTMGERIQDHVKTCTPCRAFVTFQTQNDETTLALLSEMKKMIPGQGLEQILEGFRGVRV